MYGHVSCWDIAAGCWLCLASCKKTWTVGSAWPDTHPPPSTLHLSAAACSSLPTVEHVEHGAVSVYSEASARWKCVHRTEKKRLFFWGGMEKLNDKCIYARCGSAMLRKPLLLTIENAGAAASPLRTWYVHVAYCIWWLLCYLFLSLFIDFFLRRIYFVVSRTGYTDSYNRGTCYLALLVGLTCSEF